MKDETTDMTGEHKKTRIYYVAYIISMGKGTKVNLFSSRT